MTISSRPIHVLHLVLSLQVGGAERVVVSLVRGQKEYSLKQTVCCLDEIGTLGEELIASGFSVQVLIRKPGVDWQLAWKLRKFCRQHQVDLIHTHGESPWFYGALASRVIPWTEIPCITTIHGYGGGDRQELDGYRLWKFLCLLSRKVVFVTDVFHRELKQSGMPSDKMLTIVNGVDFTPLAIPVSSVEKLKNRYDITDEFIIGIVARLSPIKNHALLLRAVARLASTSSRPLRLLIVGDGPERTNLESLVAEFCLDKQVVFCGEQSDVASYYALFNAFVLPSFSEGISMTILEAMAAGVPVIASAVGGNEEVITHGRNGLLFSSNNLDGLVSALLAIMEDSEMARMLSREGRSSVHTTFSMKTMLKNYRQLYNEVLGISPPDKEFS
ncbi:glycosyltransferase [Thermodesulfobacteriota bacterium B35]